jgi:hypothetical protein
MGVTDLIDEHALHGGFGTRYRWGTRPPAHWLPAAFPIHPLDEGIDQPLFCGGQGQRQQRRLAIKLVGHGGRDDGPMCGRQGGVAQGHHHPVARFTLSVAIGLQQLEALARGGLFAPKEHDPQFECRARPKQPLFFL